MFIALFSLTLRNRLSLFTMHALICLTLVNKVLSELLTEKQIYQLKYSVYTILFVFSLIHSLN